MLNNNKRKDALLGESHGAASHRLRKMLMFKFAGLLGLDICHQCKRKIEKVEDLSVEHTVPWQSAPDPRSTFFDLEKIAFSHLRCNIQAAVRVNKLDPDERRRRKLASQQVWNRRVYTPEYRRTRYLNEGR